MTRPRAGADREGGVAEGPGRQQEGAPTLVEERRHTDDTDGTEEDAFLYDAFTFTDAFINAFRDLLLAILLYLYAC